LIQCASLESLLDSRAERTPRQRTAQFLSGFTERLPNPRDSPRVSARRNQQRLFRAAGQVPGDWEMEVRIKK